MTGTVLVLFALADTHLGLRLHRWAHLWLNTRGILGQWLGGSVARLVGFNSKPGPSWGCVTTCTFQTRVPGNSHVQLCDTLHFRDIPKVAPKRCSCKPHFSTLQFKKIVN